MERLSGGDEHLLGIATAQGACTPIGTRIDNRYAPTGAAAPRGRCEGRGPGSNHDQII